MKILQIGREDWSREVELPEDLIWYHTEAEQLPNLIQQLTTDELEKLPEEEREYAKVRLNFSGVLLTSVVKESDLEIIADTFEPYSIFYTKGLVFERGEEKGLFRRKMLREFPIEGSHESTITFIHQTLFPSQYGAKLKIPDIDVNPNFAGEVIFDGHVRTCFKGHFGIDFQPLFTYRYNISSFPCAIEIWQEYTKTEVCDVKIVVNKIQRGTTYTLLESIVIEGEDLNTPYVLPVEEKVGFYSVSIFARGIGEIDFGTLHWRYSRQGLGQFVLGGNRFNDSKRQEFIYYFHPGDMKPPLNVYFSGFRAAEGFEGYFMMRTLGAPFMLIGDPRLEGGSFYIGSEELESKVEEVIQESLDYLGFDSSQLILSGLSMGTFGALYYASHFNPGAVVVGKPFVNIGTSARGMKLKRPDEFETSADIVKNITGDIDDDSLQDMNKKFWRKFEKSDFLKTQFAIAYMENDDYDPGACGELIQSLSDRNTHIYTKGYMGRHNDNSPSINKWFTTQYKKLLADMYGREN